MMSREDKLFSMTMACLVEVADKLGIKIDKKGAKAKAVAKILAAEAERDAKEAEAKEAEKDSLEISNAIVADFERDDDTCADGTAYVEIGKEIAEEAKAKAKKAKAEKKAKKSAENAVNVKEALIAVLDGCNAKYKVSSKRIRIYDANGPIAILMLNKSSVNAFIKDVCLSDALDGYFKEITDEGYIKSGYNNCLGINAEDFKSIIPNLIKEA